LSINDNWIIIDSITGDLNNDSSKELVVAYDVKDDSIGNTRILVIYKSENDKWIEWTRSNQALKNADGGGMMGDPFADIKIEKGILKIYHEGGSSWKWNEVDKYRFQNDNFYLIGYQNSYGKLCEYFENVDFNISTGKIIIKKRI
jgi:hypothetical protein